MPFDWITFFERYRIDYRDHGPNVGTNHVVIRCPFCGHQDPGMHMSVSTEGKGWHCWRDNHHAGINPNRLISSLLNIDWSSAAAISGTSKGYQQQPPVQAQNFAQKVNFLMAGDTASITATTISFPKTAQPLSSDKPTALPYRLYLKQRGIADPAQLDRWDMRFDHHDQRWHGRILFGVRSMQHNGMLVAMTGRAISHRMEPRYLAEGAVDRHLIWTDRMPPKADTLILTEGPFDALKVNLLGNRHGIWSTCCMTSSFSPTQRAHLYALLPRFRRTLVLFDRGNEPAGYRLAAGFGNRIGVLQLPSYAKDPAELTTLDWLIEDRDVED